MPHTVVLRELAKQAVRSAAGQGVAEVAKRYWSSIESDSRTPDKPYPEEFRKAAFAIYGEETRNKEFHASRRARSGSRR